MTTPRGNTYSYAYDTWGQLARDGDPAGGFKTLTETTRPTGYTVDVTTALGRTSRYAVDKPPIGSTHRMTTDPAGLQETLVRGTDDTWTTNYPDGSQQSTTLGPDPRFLMQAPIAKDSTFTTPGGLTYHLAEDRTATLTNPQDRCPSRRKATEPPPTVGSTRTASTRRPTASPKPRPTAGRP